MVGPLPARNGLREGEALRSQRYQIGERGVVAIRGGGGGREHKRGEERERA